MSPGQGGSATRRAPGGPGGPGSRDRPGAQVRPLRGAGGRSRPTVVFGGATILTAPGLVMTPRPSTEALVDAAVELIASRSVRVADVGTGTGAIAIALALRAPGARIWAIDDDEAAVALARVNVMKHRLKERVEVVLGNLLEPAPGELNLVLANLPYHAAARSRGPDKTANRDQPEHAIYARGDGLQLNRDLIEACRTQLDEQGTLIMQLYGSRLSSGRGELDQLLEEIETRAAEGWEARAAAAAAGTARRWDPWHAVPSLPADERAERGSGDTLEAGATIETLRDACRGCSDQPVG